jgi:hypothetical protein
MTTQASNLAFGKQLNGPTHHSLIASLAFVELDCIQFDYIHWVELLGTTEWIRTLAFRCYKDKFQRSNHSTRLDIQ